MKEHGLPDDVDLYPARPWSSPAGSDPHLQALIEHSPIAILILDAHHRYRMCNPAFEKLFQFTHSELLVTDPDDLIAGPELAHEAAYLSDRVLQGSKVHIVTQRRRKDGTTLDVELHGVPLMVDGELTGVYALYQDVTERNRARTALLQMSDKLQNLQQEERRRLARDLHDSTSQELAVLNWNLSRLQRLVQHDEDSALHELVEQTKELAYQCSAKIRSASYLLHPPLLEKAGLCSAVSWLAEGFEQRSGIRVLIDSLPQLGRISSEAEVAVFQTLQESLSNVLRHSGSPVVRISLRKNAQWLRLAVSDEGKGTKTSLSTEDLPKSVHGGLQQRDQESLEARGLGIRGMRERLEQLGGSLTVSRSSRGTTLVATVPAEVC
ncbi:MAG TPA: PAS domain S-box protein [Granulicella sp.]|nr:PAS domain S-box protein [Granulicella sp.]